MNQDLISRQEAIAEIVKRLGIRDESYLTAQEKSVVQVLRDMPSAQPEKMQLSTEKTQLSEEDATKGTTFDCISREDAIDVLAYFDEKDPLEHTPQQIIMALPSVQPELSDAYMKAVYTWLLDYQIKTAELKGRYTPYEVLSWVVNDWRKEYE